MSITSGSFKAFLHSSWVMVRVGSTNGTPSYKKRLLSEIGVGGEGRGGWWLGDLSASFEKSHISCTEHVIINWEYVYTRTYAMYISIFSRYPLWTTP